METATILFTDVVGSTELRARLGEAEADRLFLDHQRDLGRVIATHGGRLVKTSGDGVMATFGAASQAVGAAVALQSAVRESSPEISVRVGIAAGDVAWDEGDCFGLPVVTAARLQAAANGGQILVSHIVRLLAGDRAGDRYHPAGTLELKGLPMPVEAYEVGWDSPGRPPAGGTPERPSLPRALVAPTAHGLLGREQTMSELHDVWQD